MDSFDCKSMQLIDGAGTLNVRALDDFINKTQLSDCGYSYSIVSIIGPQSSGKSTILNKLFETNFKTMDSDLELSQTTKGVWIAKCNNVKPFTIAMDIEGADGREREDDTTFEKRSALFAFAVSDIVMINMYWNDAGKNNGGCKPLLKTVFQHMVRFFKSTRKITLLFVLRDKANLGSKLKDEVLNDITKIWKAATQGLLPFSDYFNVEIRALAHYKHEEQQFKFQVENLREWFSNPIFRRDAMVHDSGFSISVQKIWKIIQEDKDLDLPAHGELVSSHIFTRIAKEQLNRFTLDKRWVDLVEQVAQSGPVEDFGARAGSIRDDYLKEYDEKTCYITGKSKAEIKQEELRSGISEVVQPVVQKMLNQLNITVFDELRNKIKDTLKTAEEPNKAAESLVQSCLDKFSESSKGLIYEKNNDYFSNTYGQLTKEMNLYSQSCLSEHKVEIQELLFNLRTTIFNESTNEIDSALESAEDPAALAITLTQFHVNRFEKSSEGIKNTSYASDMRVGLQNDIKRHALSQVAIVMAERQYENQMKLNQLRDTTFNESRNAIDSLLENSQYSIEAVEKLIQRYLAKFDKSCEGIPFIKDRTTVSQMRLGLENEMKLMKLNAISRQKDADYLHTLKFKEFLTKLRSTIFNESKGELDSLLDRTDPVSAVMSVKNNCLKKFNESCEGYPLKRKESSLFFEIQLGLEKDIKLGLEKDIELHAYMHLTEMLKKRSDSMDWDTILKIGIPLLESLSVGLSALLPGLIGFFGSFNN